MYMGQVGLVSNDCYMMLSCLLRLWKNPAQLSNKFTGDFLSSFEATKSQSNKGILIIILYYYYNHEMSF